jgi:hypothetical protein
VEQTSGGAPVRWSDRRRRVSAPFARAEKRAGKAPRRRLSESESGEWTTNRASR